MCAPYFPSMVIYLWHSYLFLYKLVFAMLLKSSLHNLQFCTHHGCLPIILIIILSGSIVCTLLFTNRSELYLHCLHNNSGFCGNLVDPRFSPGILVSFSEESFHLTSHLRLILTLRHWISIAKNYCMLK